MNNIDKIRLNALLILTILMIFATSFFLWIIITSSRTFNGYNFSMGVYLYMSCILIIFLVYILINQKIDYGDYY